MVLCNSADGQKCKAYVIFEGTAPWLLKNTNDKRTVYQQLKALEAEGKIPHNIVWGVNEHGWMKTIDMIRFQRHVYDIRPMKRSVNEPSICHADIFGPHCDQDVVNLFERMHTDLNYCAGNCTSVGSPLDVNGMHIFKARVKKEFAKWRQDQDDTPDTRQSPGMMHIMQWVSKAWDAVPPEQLQKGWKKAKLWYLLTIFSTVAVYRRQSWSCVQKLFWKRILFWVSSTLAKETSKFTRFRNHETALKNVI